jgi:hypothetical protein
MPENLRLAAYLTLVQQTEQETPNFSKVDRRAGGFAQALFDAMESELLREEMRAAVIIGHHRGCIGEHWSPHYAFLVAQVAYWEAVYHEAEQFWLRRYRGGEVR